MPPVETILIPSLSIYEENFVRKPICWDYKGKKQTSKLKCIYLTILIDSESIIVKNMRKADKSSTVYKKTNRERDKRTIITITSLLSSCKSLWLS